MRRSSQDRRRRVLARRPRRDNTFLPHFQALARELNAHLDELTTRVIRDAIDQDVSEATETNALGSGS